MIIVMLADRANEIFEKAIRDYHVIDEVDQPFENAYSTTDLLAHLFYKKCWIDTVQWHYEDEIRDPQIQAVYALVLKRKIDASNQERTDMVEYIDSYFLDKYKTIIPRKEASINTESPAWSIDRLSILALKIYHMNEEVRRVDASENHKLTCKEKLGILLEQRDDLITSIDTLMEDIRNGDKYMKVYKQMKMYNDEETNPILRNKK